MHHKWKVFKTTYKSGNIVYDKATNLLEVADRRGYDTIEIKMIEDFGGYATSLMADIFIDDLKEKEVK